MAADVIDFQELPAIRNEAVWEYGLSDEQIDQYAKTNDLTIILPNEYEVQVDIDSDDLTQFHTQLGILRQTEYVRSYTVSTSRSGNRHVVVTLHEAHTLEKRVAYAAILGSDIKREALNLRNIRNGRKRPVFLYENDWTLSTRVTTEL